MNRDFTHTIEVATSRGSAKTPLRATVTATFDNEGTIDRWGLAIQGNAQSVKNRDTLRRILRGPCRDGISGGDSVGATWAAAERLEIWVKDRFWILSPKQARTVCDEIDIAIGRFKREMGAATVAAPKPTPMPAPAPFAAPVREPTHTEPTRAAPVLQMPAATVDQQRRIRELEAENLLLKQQLREAHQMVAFYRERQG